MAHVRAFILTAAALFVLLGAATAQVTINVPVNQPTIQGAINAAKDGDTILVAPGTYYEWVDYGGKNVIVRSTDGPEKTIIDGSKGTGLVVSFRTGEGNGAVLSGFTVQKGGNSYYAIYSYSSSPVIEHNIIKDNSCGEGSAVNLNFSSAILRNNKITNNGKNCFASWMSAVYVGGAGHAQVLYNEISDNTGTGIRLWAAGNALVEGNAIHDNVGWSSQGGGMDIQNEGSSIIRNNVIFHNLGGVQWGRMPGDFSNNTVAYNSSSTTGISEINAFSWWDGTFRNNVVVPVEGGTAIKCESSSTYGITPANFTFNDVFGNGGTAYTCPAMTGSNNNVSVDPMFADAAGGDFHVSTGSPIIDAADPSTTPVYLMDAAGEPRVVNTLDLGGYEYQGETTFTVAPIALDFATQKVNTKSAAQSVSITNTGAKTLHLKTPQIGAEFLQSNDCALPNGVAPGQSCTAAAVFAPVSSGSKSQNLQINGANSSDAATVSLAGIGTLPAVILSPVSLDFGDQPFGSTSTEKLITLTNTGDADLNVTSVVLQGNDFQMSHDCAVVVPSGTCTLHVTFTPLFTRLRAGSITFTDDAAGSPRVVQLIGNGTGPEISFTPSSLYFMPQSVGTINAPEDLVVQNTGTADLSISSIALMGADFSQTNDCPSTLTAGSACLVTVSFKPTVYGAAYGTITFIDNAAASPQTVQLSGTGTAPLVQLTPLSATFSPETVVGTTVGPLQVTLFNSGNEQLLISGISVLGDFSQTNSCPSALLPRLSCTINVTFAPTQAGTRTGTLMVSDNAFGSPQTVSLSGQAVAAYPLPSLSKLLPNGLIIGDPYSILMGAGAGFLSGSVLTLDGKPLTTNLSNGQVSARLNAPLSGYGEHSVGVTNPAPGGGSSNTLKLTAYYRLFLSARDIVFDPYRQVFYASGDSQGSTYPNTIVIIDPYTAEMKPMLSPGARPGRLAVSDEGRFLYVSVDGTSSVKRIDLYNQQVDLEIPLPTNSGTHVVADLKVVPGQPHSVAVLYGYDSYPTAMGQYLAVYDEARARPKIVGVSLAGIAFDDDGTLYGLSDGYYSSIYKYLVDSSGVQQIASTGTAEYLRSIEARNGLVYSDHTVHDGKTLVKLGSYRPTDAYPRAAYPEPGFPFAYYVEDLSDVGGLRISAVDTTSFEVKGNVTFGVNTASVYSPKRWGVDGLAFNRYSGSGSSDNSIILLRTGITNPNAVATPAPIVSSLAPPAAIGGSGNVKLTVAGTGFAPGAVLRWNGSNRTTAYVSDTEIVAYIPDTDVVANGTATVTVINPLPGGGTSNGVSFIIGGRLTVAPLNLAFADTVKRTSSAPKTITITNSSTRVNISSIAVSGNFVETNNCGAGLDAGASCSVTVTFSPTVEGAIQGSLTITSDELIGSQSVALTGTGVGGNLTLSDTTYDFGTVLVGKTVTKKITLTNVGQLAVAISSITVIGTFTESTTCTTSLAPGQSCEITITYAPTHTGPAGGTLTITHDSATGQSNVPLSGSATDFAIATQSTGQHIATVNAGQSAAYNLSIVGAEGFSGTVTLSCTGTPSQSTCVVNPSTVTVQAGSSAPFSVTIATTGRSNAVFLPPVSRTIPRIAFAVLSLLALAALSFQIKADRTVRIGYSTAVLALVLALAGCGGGSQNVVQNHGTAAGSYTVVVSGTTAGVTRTINLTLNVN